MLELYHLANKFYTLKVHKSIISMIDEDGSVHIHQ